MAVRSQALRLAAPALEQRMNADTSDHVGPELPCARAISLPAGKVAKIPHALWK